MTVKIQYDNNSIMLKKMIMPKLFTADFYRCNAKTVINLQKSIFISETNSNFVTRKIIFKDWKSEFAFILFFNFVILDHSIQILAE